MNCDIKNIKLAPQGKLKIEWAGQQMPVLRQIKARFNKEKPLKGITLGACLHVTVATFAIKGENSRTYYRHLEAR